MKAAWRTEPLLRARAFLVNAGMWDDKREAELKESCGREVDAAVEVYLNTGKQPTDSMFDFLFARLPKSTQAQRELARKFAA